MSVILKKTRSLSTYTDHISTLAEHTQKGKSQTICSFDKFCLEKFHVKTCEPIIQELITEISSANDFSTAFDILQDWINWLSKTRQPNSVETAWVHLHDYLYYRGIKIDSKEVKYNLKFPKIHKRSPYPLKLSEIQNIINTSKRKKGIYLALISSGMRIGETLQVRKKDLDFSRSRIMIRIPAEITKAKESRITFLSKEAEDNNKHVFSLAPNDLVWGKSENWLNNTNLEGRSLYRLLENLGMDEKYPSGINKITLHSFRAYFVTKGNKVEANFGHALAGHGFYMKQYDRYSEDELEELYMKLEKEISVFDLSKKENEIQKLKRENQQLQKLIIEYEKHAELSQEML